METAFYILVLLLIYITGIITGFTACLFKLKAKVMIEVKKDVKSEPDEKKKVEENMKKLKREQMKQDRLLKKQLKAIDEFKG